MRLDWFLYKVKKSIAKLMLAAELNENYFWNLSFELWLKTKERQPLQSKQRNGQKFKWSIHFYKDSQINNGILSSFLMIQTDLPVKGVESNLSWIKLESI